MFRGWNPALTGHLIPCVCELACKSTSSCGIFLHELTFDSEHSETFVHDLALVPSWPSPCVASVRASRSGLETAWLSALPAWVPECELHMGSVHVGTCLHEPASVHSWPSPSVASVRTSRLGLGTGPPWPLPSAVFESGPEREVHVDSVMLWGYHVPGGRAGPANTS